MPLSGSGPPAETDAGIISVIPWGTAAIVGLAPRTATSVGATVGARAGTAVAVTAGMAVADAAGSVTAGTAVGGTVAAAGPTAVGTGAVGINEAVGTAGGDSGPPQANPMNDNQTRPTTATAVNNERIVHLRSKNPAIADSLYNHHTIRATNGRQIYPAPFRQRSFLSP